MWKKLAVATLLAAASHAHEENEHTPDIPQLTAEQIQSYFKDYDTNNDNVLTKEELISELKAK